VKLLLDTHTLIWWLNENPRLSALAKSAISDPNNTVHVSVATAWELSIKVGLGKLPEADEIVAKFELALADEGFSLLAISVTHVRSAGTMQSPHRDPFDRLLAAQANLEDMTLVSSDAKMATLGAPLLW
jgi:PIN domain nuclease of toxin-antitoxin system